jgi:GNAT superfamily N-acetyltransferase
MVLPSLTYIGRRRVEIRRFEKKDLPQCLKLARKQYLESNIRHIPYHESYVKNSYLNSVGNPKYLVLVAEHEQKIVGACAVNLSNYNFSYEMCVHDIFFYIEPEHRKGMLAKRFFDLVYKWGAEHGALEVILTYAMGTENARIKRFYNAMGYKHYGENYKKEIIEAWAE